MPTAASASPAGGLPPAGFGRSLAPAASAGGHAALLADLQRGGSVTSGLKKVDASQMTHKNPELRGTGVVPDTSNKTPPAVKAKPGELSQKKPPKLELEDGNKWMVVS